LDGRRVAIGVVVLAVVVVALLLLLVALDVDSVTVEEFLEDFCESRKLFNFSARSIYSPTLLRIISFAWGFFSHFTANMKSSRAE
jgi:hypothetical protein